MKDCSELYGRKYIIIKLVRIMSAVSALVECKWKLVAHVLSLSHKKQMNLYINSRGWNSIDYLVQGQTEWSREVRL
jgi:hypothetical protein